MHLVNPGCIWSRGPPTRAFSRGSLSLSLRLDKTSQVLCWNNAPSHILSESQRKLHSVPRRLFNHARYPILLMLSDSLTHRCKDNLVNKMKKKRKKNPTFSIQSNPKCRIFGLFQGSTSHIKRLSAVTLHSFYRTLRTGVKLLHFLVCFN